MDWLEQATQLGNGWINAQQQLINEWTASTASGKNQSDGFTDAGRKLAQQYLEMLTPVKPKTFDDYVADASGIAFSHYQQAWEQSQALWRQFGFAAEEEKAPPPVQELFGPSAWWSQLFSEAPFSGRLSDLPSFAGITNYDKKMALAIDEWQTLQSEIANYAFIVANVWMQANKQLQTHLEELLASESGLSSWQQVVDFWQKTSEKSLMEMYRSEEFLKAQKSLMEASTAYRKAEQSIAEETGKALHLPTRSEVDELHQKVYDLSKELRTLKKEIRNIKSDLSASLEAKSTTK